MKATIYIESFCYMNHRHGKSHLQFLHRENSNLLNVELLPLQILFSLTPCLVWLINLLLCCSSDQTTGSLTGCSFFQSNALGQIVTHEWKTKFLVVNQILILVLYHCKQVKVGWGIRVCMWGRDAVQRLSSMCGPRFYLFAFAQDGQFYRQCLSLSCHHHLKKKK